MVMLGTCAGKLNRRLALQSNTPSQDSYGDTIESWSLIGNVWAEMVSAKGSEKFTGQQDAGFDTVVWRIRYRSDLDNLDRVVFESQNYDILGVNEEGYKTNLILITKAIIGR